MPQERAIAALLSNRRISLTNIEKPVDLGLLARAHAPESGTATHQQRADVTRGRETMQYARPVEGADGIHALSLRSLEIAYEERAEAATLIRAQGYALYCRGKGAAAIECRSVGAFAEAQGARRRS